MAKTVLFIIAAAKGHLNPCFKLSKILKNADYQVYFAVPSIFCQQAVQKGFNAVPLDGFPFASNGERIHDERLGDYRVRYLDSIMDRFYDTLYHERVKKLNSVVEQIKPDIILIDAFQPSDFVVLYPLLKKYKIKFALIQTMLSFRRQNDGLPLDCGEIPDINTNYEKHWKKYYVRRCIQNFKELILYFGKTNNRLIEHKFRALKIPARYSINNQQVFRVGFDNIPEFITTPQELEYTAVKEDYQNYLGYLIDEEREENAEFDLFLNSLKGDHKIVYCSLGTIYSLSTKTKHIIGLFISIMDIAKRLTDHEFVISLTKEFQAKLGQVPDNIHFFEFVPQLLILKKAILFITHGGAQSIKEGIRNHVPMLVYPIWWDQPGFSARIQYFGLGLRGELGKDTTHEILDKIRTLTSDASYKNRLQEFDAKISKNYTEKAILRVFEETLDNQENFE